MPCDERQVYRRYCSASHDRWSAALEERHRRRGLVFQFVGPNWWGTGQVLLTAVDLHSLCFDLERFCYVSGYTMRLGSLFGYANGMSWHPDEQTAADYPNVTYSNLTFRASWKAYRLEGQLRKLARAAENSSLIWITVHGPMAEPRVTVLSDSPAVREHYSAALARHIRGHGAAVPPTGAATPPEGPTTFASSRSWDNDYGAQLAVARDMATASRATTFYFAFLSSFVQVVTARSMCIANLHSVDDPRQLAQNAYFNESFFRDARWRQTIDDDAPERRCPSWTSVYLRNMYTDSFRAERWAKIVSGLPTWHPCSGHTARRCREEFLAATA